MKKSNRKKVTGQKHIFLFLCMATLAVTGCTKKPEYHSQKQTGELEKQKDDLKEQDGTDQESATGNEEEEKRAKILTADYTEEFGPFTGGAVLYDTASGQYTYYNQAVCEEQVSPCSTFKIVSALIGLHNGVVTSPESKMGYDGTLYPVEAWNGDLDLKNAFGSSCVWYFRKLIDTVGQEEVQKEISALQYGNIDISAWNGNGGNPLPELNGFWLDSSLKISPVGQVNLLRSIFEGETIYSAAETDILKTIMELDAGLPYRVYGKTGTGSDNKAWFVGTAEKNEGVYFAVYLTGSAEGSITESDRDGEAVNAASLNTVNGEAAKQVAYRILQHPEP